MAGIRDILLISTPEDLLNLEHLLGDGSRFGVRLSYAEQPSSDGLARAFLIGGELVAGEPCALVLGDNIFYGGGPEGHLREAVTRAGLEITDPNRVYLEDGALSAVTLGRGFAWLDTGTMESLCEAGEFVRVVERAQDVPVCIPEEIAWENGWIDTGELLACAEKYGKSEYGKHLRRVAEGRIIGHREVE